VLAIRFSRTPVGSWDCSGRIHSIEFLDKDRFGQDLSGVIEA